MPGQVFRAPSNLKRRRNTPLTERQKLTIQIHHQAGKTPKEIQQLEVLKREDKSLIRLDVVKKWIKRFSETQSVETKPRSGRPPKLKSAHEDFVMNLIEKDDEITYPEIAQKLQKKFNVTCVPRTVNKYGIKNGIRESGFFSSSVFIFCPKLFVQSSSNLEVPFMCKCFEIQMICVQNCKVQFEFTGCYRPINKPELSPENIKAREKFAEKMLARSDLDQLIFSDEKLFKCDLRGEEFQSFRPVKFN